MPGRAERLILQRWLVGERPEPPPGLDWRTIAAYARAHHVVPLVWAAAPAGPGATGPAAEDWTSLGRVARGFAVTTRLILEGYARVAETLDAAGIPCLALKGIALVALDPAYVALRATSDLDLLVRPQDVEAAHAALLAAGARRHGAPRPTLEGDPALGARAATVRTTALGVYLHPLGFGIDLHVRPPSGTASADLDGVWSRSRLAPVGGRQVRVPGLEDQVLIQGEHVLEHHGAEPALFPRLVADLARLEALGAERRKAPRAVAAGWRLLDEVRAAASGKGGLVPNRVERTMLPTVGRVNAGAAKVIHAARVRLAMIRSGGLPAVFPSRAYLAASYGARPDAWWIPALHLRRLLFDQPLALLGRRRRIPPPKGGSPGHGA